MQVKSSPVAIKTGVPSLGRLDACYDRGAHHFFLFSEVSSIWELKTSLKKAKTDFGGENIKTDTYTPGWEIPWLLGTQQEPGKKTKWRFFFPTIVLVG